MPLDFAGEVAEVMGRGRDGSEPRGVGMQTWDADLGCSPPCM